MKVFAASFISVFMLGWQTQNVMQDLYLMAFLTSVAIGLSQAFVIKELAHTNCKWLYIFGGACGIVSSMKIHHLLF